ncbi:YicC family protein [Rudanella paleaurantiibacter]|uniref:YicC family protein n=1 Tax=Rudanella paleaurantiibacter TaxID=2614655 RepID=A0A7J5TT84_9BACT|nr:YicC/YloC family endoribonuclease [Rudanella paleaurantiibacter]KAB7727021.1 YicC family protein [Rudanella paleaurantiibacter]
MLKSMTGFGNATVESNNLTVTAEVKTLNSKFLDIFCRLPRQFSDKEIEIRNQLTQQLERGKVELSINYTRTGEVRSGMVINRTLVGAYAQDIRETANSMLMSVPDADVLKLALSQPNAYTAELPDPEAGASDWLLVQQAISQAIQKCDAFRRQEGASLEGKFNEYIGSITARLAEVEEQDGRRIPAVRERMRASVVELLGNEEFDRNRFEQELVYYVEKFDISEEKVRLKNHLQYFMEVLNTEEANGKKLNFIAQEIGREINTIGSKANDSAIQRLVVQMKDELEKIKEQTMNII